jgi:L-fuculose-phosphate aldolase
MTRLGLRPSDEMLALFREVGSRLDRRGLIASNDGNLSVRETDDTILVTAAGSRKGYIRDEEIIRVDLEGRLRYGTFRPSSEVAMHLGIYRQRWDVCAVVHAHPPAATAFAVARFPLDHLALPELVLSLGKIPLAPFARPGTERMGEQVAALIGTHDAVLLANHGAVTVGPDLEEAYFRMERLEHAARILIEARHLGGPHCLDPSDVE